jgi:glutathione-independent formaldehyde dehydrogenase
VSPVVSAGTNWRPGLVGVCVRKDPGAATDGARQDRIGFDFDFLFQRGEQADTGQCPVKRYNHALRDLIIAGKATPSLLVCHELPPE